MGQAFGGGMGAMSGGEGVVDIDVAKLRQRRGKRRVVLFLALVEARILEEENVAALHRRHGRRGLRADAVLGKGDRPTENGAYRREDLPERILLLGTGFRPA